MKENWDEKQILLNEIVDGFTPLQQGYIKHIGLVEQGRFERLKKKCYFEIREKGFKPLEECLEETDKNKTWTKVEENNMVGQENYIEKLRKNASTVEDKQLEYYNETIGQEVLKLRAMQEKRAKFIRHTAESMSTKMSFEKFVPELFFRDKEFTTPMYSHEEIEFWSDEEFSPVYDSYLWFRGRFNESEVKELACSGLCQNLFFAAETCSDFFGKPILALTELQQRVFLHIKNFNNIISGIRGKVKGSMLSDWKMLEKWAESGEKERERLEHKWGVDDGNDLTYEEIQRNAKKTFKSQEEKYEHMEKTLK